LLFAPAALTGDLRHLDIIKAGKPLFDKVIVLVVINPAKNLLLLRMNAWK
jgi:phosphopantetheine adenylyltransferase